MFNWFARPKPCAIMIKLRDTDNNWHLSKLAKASNSSHVYVAKLISRLHEAEVITVETKGKKRIVRLTEKGAKIANAISDLQNSFEN